MARAGRNGWRMRTERGKRWTAARAVKNHITSPAAAAPKRLRPTMLSE